MANSSNNLKVVRPHATLRELTLQKMQEAILSFHFKPGERLVERRLCDELGVSRTIVREVLRHLETEGLVSVLPNYGPSVAVIDPSTARQIYQIRAELESMAVREVATKRDPKTIGRLEDAIKDIETAFKGDDVRVIVKMIEAFYDVLFQSSGLHIALDVVRNLNARINVFRAMTVSSAGRKMSGPMEMRRIVKAIASGKVEEAVRACRRHVEMAHKLARQKLQEKAETESVPKGSYRRRS